MAALLDSGSVPDQLAGINKSYVEDAVRKRLTSNGYYHVAESDEWTLNTAAAVELRRLIDQASIIDPQKEAERRRTIKITELENEIRFVKIPGFFPTPRPIADELVKLAEIGDGMLVLEPSAGKGDLCDSIKAAHPDCGIIAMEIVPKLVEICRLRGHQCDLADFMDWQPTHQVDRVVMNPPFENGQPYDHILQALRWLKPGGRLVAIVPSGFVQNSRRADKFRQALDGKVDLHEIIKIDGSSFASRTQSFRQTGVKAAVFAANK